jgi:hypothetical protein
MRAGQIHRPIEIEEATKILRLLDAGKTVNVIAKAVGRSRYGIYLFLKRQGKHVVKPKAKKRAQPARPGRAAFHRAVDNAEPKKHSAPIIRQDPDSFIKPPTMAQLMAGR